MGGTQPLPLIVITSPPNEREGELQFINADNLKLAIKAFKNGKSPGPDNITPMLMKQLPKS